MATAVYGKIWRYQDAYGACLTSQSRAADELRIDPKNEAQVELSLEAQGNFVVTRRPGKVSVRKVTAKLGLECANGVDEGTEDNNPADYSNPENGSTQKRVRHPKRGSSTPDNGVGGVETAPENGEAIHPKTGDEDSVKDKNLNKDSYKDIIFPFHFEIFLEFLRKQVGSKAVFAKYIDTLEYLGNDLETILLGCVNPEWSESRLQATAASLLAGMINQWVRVKFVAGET
jgi:hypothetical protein